jgi:hypothetical protein
MQEMAGGLFSMQGSSLNARHLKRVLCVFTEHYNEHRPHRSLNLTAPNGTPAPQEQPILQTPAVKRRDRLLVHEYKRVA